MSRPSLGRRYLPVALVAAVAIGASILARGNGGDDASKPGAALTTEGPVILDDANVGEVAWGPNCDTDTGRVKLPTIYAPPCVAPWYPADGNGGATSPGVTAEVITIAVYEPPGGGLGGSLLAGAGLDVSAEETAQTRQGLFSLFEKTLETYGRSIEIVTVKAGGGPDDHAAGPRRCDLSRHRDQAVHRHRRSAPVERLRRGAREPRHHLSRRLLGTGHRRVCPGARAVRLGPAGQLEPRRMAG